MEDIFIGMLHYIDISYVLTSCCFESRKKTFWQNVLFSIRFGGLETNCRLLFPRSSVLYGGVVEVKGR